MIGTGHKTAFRFDIGQVQHNCSGFGHHRTIRQYQCWNLTEGPASITGLTAGELITQIDGVDVKTVEQFEKAFEEQSATQMNILTNNGLKTATLADGKLGIRVEEAKHIKESIIASHGMFLPNAFVWVVEIQN